MITEDYVSFETAKLLKEKGFDHICLMWYIDSPNTISEKTGKPIPPYFTSLTDEDGNYYYNTEREAFEYSAPTLQMAMKWLRENYSLHVNICPAVENGEFTEYYHCYVDNLKQKYPFGQFICDSPTYEEGCESAIKYCLENLI